MSRRFIGGATAMTGGALILACVVLGPRVLTQPAAQGQEPASKEAADKDVFGATKVLAVHLEIPAKEYEAMQPPAGGFGFPGAPPAPPAPAPKDKRDSERNLFGTEFRWAEGDLSTEGKTYKKVGVRYAGEVTYLVSGQGLKRPLKIEFNKFGDQQFHGLTSLNLHAMPLDPAKGREVIAYAVFRAAGVPAPRTAFAEVTLTVPGKYDKEYVGLFAVVEDVGKPFLADRFGTDKGLLMKPFQVRSMEHLGDDWERYKGQYRPQSEPTKDEAKRVIEFARLVNQASDDEFKKQIDSYLDVDEFLRFLAANALTSNLESSVALGHNYHLYLSPKTNKFVFLPGDLEFSLANFLLMGTADQLMDLSLTHPYPGDNKLVDRLLAVKDMGEKYQKLLKDLSEKVFTKERLLKDIEAVEKVTKEPLEKEKKAVQARKEQAGGFGPPGGGAPQAPDLKTFAEKRTAAVAAQLASKSKGYVPAGFGFGPPPGGGGGPPGGGAPSQPIDEKTFRDSVKAPDGFDVSLFAVPPKVNYPVALAAAPTGELFVAVDEQGSIGRTPGGGKVLRCVDKDGDGKVDEVTVFVNKIDHPRGLIYQDGRLWVLHSSFLSVYHDGGKGVADGSEVLVTGLTSDMVNQRGGDHATNGIRMGLDGWIYIAVGDYGPPEAKGKDGSKITMRGGIARVRPDGTELEIFATGLRNPFDIGMDPFMNLFTRDNDDNRAGGWDIRVSHLMQSAYYGYSQHYANFPDEIMPPLGQFGGGSGVGNLFLQDERWPEKFRNVLLTGDWGRSEVYRHELTRHGPTFDLKQEVFLKFPRPTGIDMDGSGRLYVASWRGGEASNYVGPNVGFVARVTPRGLKPAPFPDLKELDLPRLIGLLSGPNSVTRVAAQREILRRGRNAAASETLVKLASDGAAPLEGRAIAVFALKQLDGKDSHPALLKLAEDAAVREFALRALTDRKKELAGLDTKPFVAALSDESPRVRAQALISLGRLNDKSVAKSVIPLTARPKGSVMPTKATVHSQPDPDRVIPHLAVRTLISLGAVDACLEALDGPDANGALWAMRYMHDGKTVEGLIKKLGTTRSAELRRGVLATLVRLYHREADYKGAWWGIRPENEGPYYDAVEWDQSKRIGAVLTSAALDGDADTTAFLRTELARHRVSLTGLPSRTGPVPVAEKEIPVVVPKADPNNPNQIGNMTYEAAAKRALAGRGDAAKGKALFKAQLCNACHTDADGQALKGPHMVDIGKRYSAAELVESILKPSVKIAQGFETYRFDTADGKVYTGFVVSERPRSVLIREATGTQRELPLAQIESRAIQKQSMMPDGVVNNQTPEGLADLVAYLQSLNGGGDDPPKKPDPAPTEEPKPPVTLTAAQDHKLMMELLKIKELRRGADGNNPRAANAANYDEAKANPYPKLPDPLVTRDGKKVTSAELWVKTRRPEIVEDFDREIYGRVPKDVPKVKWEVTDTKKDKIGDVEVVTKKLVGHVDNSSYTPIKVDIQLTLTTPANAKGPVPVMMEFGFFFGGGGGGGPPPGPGSWQRQLLDKGWGYAIITPNSIQADNGAGLTRGIIGLCNKGQPRKADDWGSLRAWAWGASRALDYFETAKAVDAKQVGIEGLSRYGKAAIVTMAYDERFAIGFIGSSGEGGAKLHRRNFGEMVENLTSAGEYHWMAGNFLKYGGPMNPGDLPVDSHELIAMCAPRPVFISYGASTGQGAEGQWVDQRGSFMAAVAAGPVYKLLGKKDLGTAEFPALETALIDGEIAFRQHKGGHTTGPNWPTFLKFADRYIKVKPAAGGDPPPPAKPAAAGPTAPAARTDANSRTAHEQLLEKARKGRIDVYFVGDSITRRWGATDYPDFLANWKKNFHGWNAANFGWGGDTIQNILWRLHNGELDKVNPKVIVVMAGTNNIGTTVPAGGDEARVADITRGLKAVLDVCREKAPDAVLIQMGITPRNDNPAAMATINKVNEQVAKFADGKKVRYLNINDKLADKEGKLLEGMSPDRLHLSAKGYQVWADAVKPLFTELLGQPAKDDLAPPPTGDPSAAGRTTAPARK
jgi:putative membrane-bound dehydrogenase-like protein